ncbi:hypothetical protein ACFLZH_02705 [Patescibacteria group bacterium]
MKKVITLVVLLIMATATFSGCSWFQSAQEEEQPPVTATDTQPIAEDTEEPKDVTPPEPVAISDVLTPVATDKLFDELKKDPFSIGNETEEDSVTIEEDIITVKVGYTGCDKHEFTAYWPATFMESFPVQAGILLVHDANEDICEMYINDEVKISLATIKQNYKDSYRTEAGTILLSVTDGDEREGGVTYEF